MKKIIFILILAPSVLFSQWVNINHYWDIPIFEGVDIVDSNTIYVSGVQHVLKSNNGGANWFSVLSSPPGTLIRDVCFINTNTGFIIRSMGSLPFPIYKTTNGGINWYGVFNPAWNQPKRIDMVDSLYGYAACERYVYKTTDGGNNWFQCGFTALFEQYGFGIDFVNRDTGYYGNTGISSCAIYKTTNGGNNWIFFHLGGSSYITEISMCNQTTGYAVSSTVIYKTTNGNFDAFEIEEWHGIGSGMWDVSAVNPDTVFIASSQGIIKTTNGGLNWYIYPTGNNGIHGVDMLNSNTGFAVGTNRPGATIGAIYKTTNGGYIIGVEPITTSLPNSYNLQQNFPNPFNSTTQIRFELPKRSNIKLIIYDLLGKIVEILAENILDAGKFYINWNPGNLSSGIYFCKIIVDNFTDTKKMILIK